MINQQLTLFVKQSLQQGLTKEKIISELVVNGWTDKDIEECFQAIDVENMSTISLDINNDTADLSQGRPMGKKTIIIVLVIILILIGLFIFRNEWSKVKDTKEKTAKEYELLIQDQKFAEDLKGGDLFPAAENKEVVESKIAEVIGTQKPVVIAKTTATLKVPTKVVTKTSTTATPALTPVVTKPVVSVTPTNCGENMSCFQKAVPSCSPSSVIKNISINLFGLNQSNIQKFSLTGFDTNGKCGFSSETIASKVDFSQETKDAPEFQTATAAEKDEILIPANESVKKTIGMIITCHFTTADIATLLADFEKDQTSSVNMDSENCSMTGGTFDEDVILL